MKKFLLRSLLFIFPFLLLLIAIELYVLYYPSTFNLKAHYLKNNIKEIQTMILGSSHNQNAFNPEFFHSKTVNLANAGQDIQLDSALFFTYIKQLKSVNLVIIEMDYHTMEEKNDSENFRIPWYKRFYNFELHPISFLNNISLYSSNPSFFNKLLIDEINPKKIRYKLNKYGFILNDFPGVMEELKYDSVKLSKTSHERMKDKHKTISPDIFQFNRSKLDAIINYCILNNIKVKLISTPMYATYVQNEIAEKNKRRRLYIDSLVKKQPVLYYDYEYTNFFNVYDFKNDDHLNSRGAKKFSMMIDSIINQKETYD